MSKSQLKKQQRAAAASASKQEDDLGMGIPTLPSYPNPKYYLLYIKLMLYYKSNLNFNLWSTKYAWPNEAGIVSNIYCN